MEVIEEFVSNVLLFFTNLPCHVVALQSYIRVIYGCSISCVGFVK